MDEFQDTNFIQNKWLNLLVNDNLKNICWVLVMMTNQFIVGEGQKLKNFLTFDQIYKIVKYLN